MSTSLKVVSIAAVFCTSFSRRAMVWRSRVIRTRSSREASSGGDGARTCTAAAGWLIGVGCEAAFSIAASMSPLVTRPSLPLPGTVEASTPLSADSLRTDGASGASAGAPSPQGLAAAAGAAAFAGAAAAAGFAPPAPSVIWPSSAPTATVSPSLATMSPSTPAAGAGTSIVTLSVSSSTSGSSTATVSPGFLNHLPMVASVTDSPRVGTRISVMIVSSWRHGRARPGHSRLFASRSGTTRVPATYEQRRASRLCPSTRLENQPNASSRNALSCARCFDINPVAVAADAGRPA